MKKMSTLFKIIYHSKHSKDFDMLDEIRPENLWVVNDKENVKATRKFDGTAIAIIDGILYKRYDAKPTKDAIHNHIDGIEWNINDFRTVPKDAIPCSEPDKITGHFPHWIKVLDNDKSNKYLLETFKNDLEDGTYEFCGEKVQNNPEKIIGHKFIKHGYEVLPLNDYSYNGIKSFLEKYDIEGIVFHHKDGRMCKIRKSDFKLQRNPFKS